MEIALSQYGQTFATRERAREILALADPVPSPDDEPRIDLTGVMASPSFMAELLNQLAVRHLSITVIGGSEYLQVLTKSLVERLGLSGRVRIGESATAA